MSRKYPLLARPLTAQEQMRTDATTRTGDNKIRCEQCGKPVGGLRQHRRDVHGSPNRVKTPGNAS